MKKRTADSRSNGVAAQFRIAATAVLSLAAFAVPAWAQVSSYGDKQIGPSNNAPAVLNGVGIAQHLNYQLPLGLTFIDDEGKQVALNNYFGKKPAILAVVYYNCPSLCSEELQGLTGALKMIRFRPGKEFSVIVASIDPTEDTALAASKKSYYVKVYGHPETAGYAPVSPRGSSGRYGFDCRSRPSWTRGRRRRSDSAHGPRSRHVGR